MPVCPLFSAGRKEGPPSTNGFSLRPDIWYLPSTGNSQVNSVPVWTRVKGIRVVQSGSRQNAELMVCVERIARCSASTSTDKEGENLMFSLGPTMSTREALATLRKAPLARGQPGGGGTVDPAKSGHE